MYYGVDENSDLVMSDSVEVLPEDQQSLFEEESVSSGDQFPTFTEWFYQSVSDSDLSFYAAPTDYLTYDNMVDLFANIPGYLVYPNTSSVSVFEKVLNGLDNDVYYIVISGSDTNNTYLYYSKKYSISGNVITLKSPVTVCQYYQYRTSVNADYQYTYTVSQTGDSSYTIGNTLFYTNLVDGYPDLIPYQRNASFSLIAVCALCAVVVAVCNFRDRFHRKDK